MERSASAKNCNRKPLTDHHASSACHPHVLRIVRFAEVLQLRAIFPDYQRERRKFAHRPMEGEVKSVREEGLKHFAKVRALRRVASGASPFARGPT